MAVIGIHSARPWSKRRARQRPSPRTVADGATASRPGQHAVAIISRGKISKVNHNTAGLDGRFAQDPVIGRLVQRYSPLCLAQNIHRIGAAGHGRRGRIVRNQYPASGAAIGAAEVDPVESGAPAFRVIPGIPFTTDEANRQRRHQNAQPNQSFHFARSPSARPLLGLNINHSVCQGQHHLAGLRRAIRPYTSYLLTMRTNKRPSAFGSGTVSVKIWPTSARTSMR